jgi:hypothetical protein
MNAKTRSLVKKEIKDLICASGGLRSEGAYEANIQAMPARQFHALHGAAKISLTALRVVDLFGTVQTGSQ